MKFYLAVIFSLLCANQAMAVAVICQGVFKGKPGATPPIIVEENDERLKDETIPKQVISEEITLLEQKYRTFVKDIYKDEENIYILKFRFSQNEKVPSSLSLAMLDNSRNPLYTTSVLMNEKSINFDNYVSGVFLNCYIAEANK